MTKKSLSPADAFYGPDGPKSGPDSTTKKTSAGKSIDDYFRNYGPAQERFHARRGATSPLGNLAKQPKRK